MHRIRRLPRIALLLLAPVFLLARGREPEAPRRATAAARDVAVPVEAARAAVDREAGESGPVTPSACADPRPAVRVMELVFDGITETWRGREVGLHLFRADANQRHDVRVEVGPSVLCNVPVGYWDLELRDDRGRFLWPTRGAITRSDATIHLRLPAGCRVQGNIATADRSPFVGSAYFGDVDHNVITDADGAFDVGFLPKGAHAVRVLCESGFVTVGRIEVGGEGTMRVHVAIRGNGRFEGALRYEPEVMIGLDIPIDVLRIGHKEPVASMYLERGGRFEMGYLEPGSYELRSNALAAPVAFAVWAGECTDVGTIEPLPPLEWHDGSDGASRD
jgi:hypothetical protein